MWSGSKNSSKVLGSFPLNINIYRLYGSYDASLQQKHKNPRDELDLEIPGLFLGPKVIWGAMEVLQPSQSQLTMAAGIWYVRCIALCSAFQVYCQTTEIIISHLVYEIHPDLSISPIPPVQAYIQRHVANH